jgi:hypothetical protein
MNLSLVFTQAERGVWDALPQRFKYVEVKKYKGSGYRMFKKAQEHGLIKEIGSGFPCHRRGLGCGGH